MGFQIFHYLDGLGIRHVDVDCQMLELLNMEKMKETVAQRKTKPELATLLCYEQDNFYLGESAPGALHRDGPSLHRSLDTLRHLDQLKGVDFLHDFCNI